MKTISPSTRWIVLVLVSVVIATNYYVYDAMSSIKSVMQTQLGIDNTAYGLIVSFYSFPNTFLLMSIFGGIILDKWGIRKTGFLFVLVCFLGALTTAYGASDSFARGGVVYGIFDSFLPSYSPQLKMMMLGRLLFGLGAETSIVVINKIIVKWFKGKELAFAFAVNVAIARLGTALALIFSPQLIKDPVGWTWALWVAAIAMGVGFVFFLIYMMYDSATTPKGSRDGALAADEEFHMSDIVELLKNRSFIYVILLCVTFYSAVFPFQAYCPDLLHNKFGLDIEWSGILSSLIIWGTILFTPLFGAFVDRKGKRASLMLVGSFLLIATHLILSLTHVTPYVAMFILGIAFSLVPASMWPSVALIVEEKRLGTAYGMMAALQNLGLWGFPILAGYILDTTNPGVTETTVASGTAMFDYTYTILMFAVLGFVGFFFAIMLKREDAKAGNKLELA
ncbi:MAG: MFS transporter [Ignavibacteria bacterium]|nr:MFS transporter [Ignavibacteria bacterium]